MSLSPAALTTFAYNCTSGKYRVFGGSLKSCLKMVYFRMMGLIEKSFSDSKACLLSSSSSTPVVFPFSILQWYLRSLAGSG